jgi:hypothetical protein
MSTMTTPAGTVQFWQGENTPGRRVAGILAVSGVVGFTVATIVAAFGYPGYSHVSYDISALSGIQSPWAPVMIAGFVALVVGLVSAGIALRSRLSGRAGRAASTLGVVFGLSILVPGFAREDCATTEAACKAAEKADAVSTHHVVHELSSLVAFLLGLALLFVLASAARRTAGFEHLARPTRITAIACIAMLFAFLGDAFGAWQGLGERLYVAAILGWPVLFAVVRPRVSGNGTLPAPSR